MPAAAQYVFLAMTSNARVCPSCGSKRLEYLEGYYTTGVVAPDGAPERHWLEAIRCRDCGEIQEP
jgi:DNA-directed RNA polymerase subunit RPC12/RpoP